MMMSFAQVWEAMDKMQSPLMDSGDSSEIISIMRAGEDLRSDNETSFWNDFINLCSNSNGLAELLGVSPEKVLGWPAKIKSGLESLKKHKEEEGSTEVISTGDGLNSDPNLGKIN